MKSNRGMLVWAPIVVLLCLSAAFSQSNSYQQTNLVSDIPGMAAHTDANLVNPWGISFVPQQPLWIANNGSGTSTIYDQAGATALPPVTIPPPTGGSGTGTVTGTVANTTGGFALNSVPQFFIFATEDGTISAWSQGAAATIAVNNSAAGAVYKGLASGSVGAANFIYAANFSQGRVDVFDASYHPATLAGNFTDPTLPAGYAPFGIQNIGNNQIVVTYALQDVTKHDDVAGAGNGYVSLFDTNGNFVRRIASQGSLNSPWGIAVAPAGFGAFGGALLIGNFGDGRISAFDLSNGSSMGQLNGTNGNPLSIDGLWALEFGGGGTAGDPNALYFTAGLNGETHGLFGSLSAAVAAGTADFSLGAAQTSIALARGGSSTVQINVTGTGGFASSVALSCTNLPAQTSCRFSPPSVIAGSTAVSSMLTVSATSTYPRMAMLRSRGVALLSTLGFGLGGFCFIGSLRRRSKSKLIGMLALGLVCAVMLFQTACGGSKSSNSGGTAGGGGFTMTVDATGGGVTHSTNIVVSVQ
jgi:uncharacterized protein (TIGR03118 family)